MKKMKLLSLTIVLFATVQSHFVQAQGSFNLGLELGMPIGDFGDLSSVGLGLNGFYEHAFNDKLTIVGGTGYTKWFLKDGLEDVLNIAMVPVQAGAKYYLGEKAYLQGLLGLHIYLSSAEIFDQKERDSDSEFGFGLGGGIKITENLDLSGRFQLIDDANFFALRLGYVFGK